MLEKITNKLLSATVGIALIACSAAAEAKEVKCLPKETQGVIGIIKQKTEPDTRGSYTMNFTYNNHLFTLTYEDRGAGSDKKSRNGIIDHYDGIEITKEKIIPNPDYKLSGGKKYFTECSRSYLDENLDGHGSPWSVFGYKPTLKCGKPLDKDSKILKSLIHEAYGALKSGNYKSAKNVERTPCE